MDLDTIPISPDEAKERLAQYTALLHAERTAEDDAIAAGYRAAARGLPVISLSRTITAGGWHDNGLPRIAVIHATATECFGRWDGGDVIFADTNAWGVNRGALVGQHSVRVPIPGDGRPGQYRSGWTIVPLIPPRHRPRPRRLARCHILWEVEEWKPVAPRDPALLRHIRGDLWAVLAEWDLTELERLVLTQRGT